MAATRYEKAKEDNTFIPLFMTSDGDEIFGPEGLHLVKQLGSNWRSMADEEDVREERERFLAMDFTIPKSQQKRSLCPQCDIRRGRDPDAPPKWALPPPDYSTMRPPLGADPKGVWREYLGCDGEIKHKWVPDSGAYWFLRLWCRVWGHDLHPRTPVEGQSRFCLCCSRDIKEK